MNESERLAEHIREWLEVSASESRKQAAALRALVEPRPLMICPAKVDGRCRLDLNPHCKPHNATGGCRIRCYESKKPNACIPVPEPGPELEKLYHCADCGVSLTVAEGGAVFTLCDECWKKQCPPRKPPVRVIDRVEPDAYGVDAAREYWCRVTAEICPESPVADCDKCQFFQQAASEWARNSGSFTEHK